MLEKFLTARGLNDQDLEQARNTSRIYSFQGEKFQWDGVEVQSYKPEGNSFDGIIRQVIAGYTEQTAFHLRYFEIAPGGHSSLEKHQHTHVVIGIRGRGKVVMGSEVHDVNFLDTFYVAPGQPHQFVNLEGEPFGFFCIVDAERDKPQPLSEDELAVLKSTPAAEVIREEKVVLEKLEK